MAHYNSGTRIPVPDDFPVVWLHPDDVKLHWSRDTEHNPGPQSPLMASWDWVDAGVAHGFRYWEAPFSASLTRRINTFSYGAEVPLTLPREDLEARALRAEAKLGALIEDVEGEWERSWWPRIDRALTVLDALNPDGVSDETLVRFLAEADASGRELWEVHFELVFGLGYVRREFDRFLRELFGADTDFGTPTLTAGLPSWSAANGEALMGLAELAAAHPDVAAAISSGSWDEVAPRLDTAEGGALFREKFGEFVAVHGKKLAGEFTDPTWDEDLTLPLENLRAVIRRGGDFGRGQRAQVIRDREARLNEVRGRLSSYPRVVVEEFLALLKAATAASRLMEDHNFYIDQKSPYYFRRLVMEVARRLTERGVLSRPEDIQYLETGELAPALRGELEDVRTRIETRRCELSRWKDYDAPVELGTVSGPPPAHPLFGGGGGAPVETPEPPADPALLRGVPASRGVVIGTVRVIRSLAEASTLEPGEILVTLTTSPSWATWYPVLGGLVTEAGGALSHAAVVAREYGIPAVVAVKEATRRLQTGMRVELCGDDGTIRVIR